MIGRMFQRVRASADSPCRRSPSAFARGLGLWLALAGLAGLPALVDARDSSPKDSRHEEAEHARISDEMERLSQRKAWSGVDRLFRKLEAMSIDPSLENYMHGAYAARELGDVMSVQARLKAAAKSHQSKEIVEWLWEIDNTYGRVELVSVPERATTLEVARMPFDPDQRKAVDAAIAAVGDNGVFVGMLPEGEFTFSGQQFKVEPGISVRIEVSPRVRRHGPIAPVIVYPDGKGAGTGTETPSKQETP